VFKSEKVNLAEVTEKLKQAVEHYSSLPHEESSAPQSPGIAPGNTRLAITNGVSLRVADVSPSATSATQ